MDKPSTCEITAYYDGSCPACRAEIAHYRSKTDPTRVAFVDITDANTTLPPGLERPEALARFHIQADDGRIVSGVSAFAEVWNRAQGWRWLGRAARLPGVLFVMERLYRAVLPARPFLSRAYGRLTGATRRPDDVGGA